MDNPFGIKDMSYILNNVPYSTLPQSIHQPTFRQVLRYFSACGNIPSKSICFLAADYAPKTSLDLSSRANRIMGYPIDFRINEGTFEAYANSAFFKLTFFLDKNKRRVWKDLGMLMDDEDIDSPNNILFSKNIWGYGLGDMFALMGISTSLIDNLPSGYKLWSYSSTPGESSRQETRLLILDWLQKNGSATLLEMIRDIYQFTGPTNSQGGLNPELSVYLNRAFASIRSLNDCRALRYDSRMGDEIITKLINPNIDMTVFPDKIRYYPGGVNKVIASLTKLGKATNKNISKDCGINIVAVGKITYELRLHGYAVEEFPKSYDGASFLEITKPGKQFINMALETLNVVGWEEINKTGVHYANITKPVSIKLDNLLTERERLLTILSAFHYNPFYLARVKHLIDREMPEQ